MDTQHPFSDKGGPGPFGGRRFGRGHLHRRPWLKAPLILVVVVAAIAIFGYVVMQLWNHLIPDLFHGPVLGFWQAVGLLILVRIFTHSGPRWRGGRGGWRNHRHFLKERWERMTPEEREKFREKLKSRCGDFRGPWDDQGDSRTAQPGNTPSASQ